MNPIRWWNERRQSKRDALAVSYMDREQRMLSFQRLWASSWNKAHEKMLSAPVNLDRIGLPSSAPCLTIAVELIGGPKDGILAKVDIPAEVVVQRHGRPYDYLRVKSGDAMFTYALREGGPKQIDGVGAVAPYIFVKEEAGGAWPHESNPDTQSPQA